MLSSSRFMAGGLLLGTLVLSGCGTSYQAMDDYGANTTTRGTNDAMQLGTDVTIPETFPADIPRYPGATTQIAIYTAAQNGYSLNQQTTDDATKVRTWIDQTMTANGFQKTSDIPGDPTSLVGYTKGNIKFNLQISRDNQKGLTYIIVARSGS